MELVVAQNLGHTFGNGELKVDVLGNLSMSIRSGEVVILTGPSGSGKTTLLTLIGALRTTQTGSLEVFGRQLRGANEKVLLGIRRRVGYIFQAQNLHRSLTAWQNVAMGLEVQQRLKARQREALARTWLAHVGLSERANFLPAQLSGGQRQRVAVARALAGGPELVLADEPTASLDGRAGRAVVELLIALAKEQKTAILLVTHDHRLVDIADRRLGLEDGQIAEHSDRMKQ